MRRCMWSRRLRARSIARSTATPATPSTNSSRRVEMSVATVTDEKQIRRIMDDWRRLTAEGNADGLLSLLADDVIFLTPGNAPMTKADFAAGFRQVSTKARIESTQEVKDIRVS